MKRSLGFPALSIVPAAFALLATGSAHASSHMDAPLITLDDAANTTDVYAFVSGYRGNKYLTTALAVYPFEEPGIGPNKYNFDDNVLYQIHVSKGNDLPQGKTTLSYEFSFTTKYKNRKTVLQSYLGVIKYPDDAGQNLTQSYTVTKVDRATNTRTKLGDGIVPPNNQGIATPHYNLDSGNGPAKDGVATENDLDRYTSQAVYDIASGYRCFAGQRDDGFYADIHAVFDLLQLRGPGKGFDSQGGFNLHTMVLQIPVAELGGDAQSVGVWASTSRRRINYLPDFEAPINVGDFVQVGRQGNPLFCEALVAIADKDLYNRTPPEADNAIFRIYALEPELAKLLNAIVFAGNPIPGIETNRTDIAGIFIPDLIKVDLSTRPARLAGNGPADPKNPDDAGYSRNSIFGGDVLFSSLANGNVPGGWPNGRRFGDDVTDIAVSALISDLRVNPPVIRIAGDNVDKNDMGYNKVMPYAGTPQNGRNHTHHR